MALHGPRHLGRLTLSSPRPLAPAYTTAASTARSFSCTAQRPALPPQSPDYIPVPKPPFSEEKKPARVRGDLPVPRKVFPLAGDSRKLKASYVEETYPHSKHEPAPETLKPDHPRNWKRLMAENRRTNLRSGLEGLWDRKDMKDKRDAKIGREKHRAHMKAGLAPESVDEFLTRPTIRAETLQTKVLPDPDRFKKAKASRQLTEQKEAEKKEARRDAIMEMYMNAREFIVDEKQLEAEVHRMFSENFWRDPAKDRAWVEWGTQPGIFDMVGRVAKDSPGNALEQYTADYSRNMKRQKTTAEALTGGKMLDRGDT